MFDWEEDLLIDFSLCQGVVFDHEFDFQEVEYASFQFVGGVATQLRWNCTENIRHCGDD